MKPRHCLFDQIAPLAPARGVVNKVVCVQLIDDRYLTLAIDLRERPSSNSQIVISNLSLGFVQPRASEQKASKQDRHCDLHFLISSSLFIPEWNELGAASLRDRAVTRGALPYAVGHRFLQVPAHRFHLNDLVFK